MPAEVALVLELCFWKLNVLKSQFYFLQFKFLEAQDCEDSLEKKALSGAL